MIIPESILGVEIFLQTHGWPGPFTRNNKKKGPGQALQHTGLSFRFALFFIYLYPRHKAGFGGAPPIKQPPEVPPPPTSRGGSLGTKARGGGAGLFNIMAGYGTACVAPAAGCTITAYYVK